MAHKSKKKHLKHLREHAPVAKAAHPGSKAASAALASETSHKAQLTSTAKAAVKAATVKAAAVKAAAVKARAASVSKVEKEAPKAGLVRSIAKAATDKLAAKPRRMIAKAKARVRSILGRSERSAA